MHFFFLIYLFSFFGNLNESTKYNNFFLTTLPLSRYSLFSPLCTCPVMDISPTIKFTWDANKIVRSVQVNASSWVTCLSNWVQELMEGLDEFVANQGKGGFLSGSTIGGREKGFLFLFSLFFFSFFFLLFFSFKF